MIYPYTSSTPSTSLRPSTNPRPARRYKYGNDLNGLSDAAFLSAVLAVWEAGSVFFTLGALSLGYRHWVMHI